MMRLLTYSISALTGLLGALVMAAIICTRSAPPPVATPIVPTPTAVVQPAATLPPRPWEAGWDATPQPVKYRNLDAAGLAKRLGGPDVVAVLERADRFTSVLLRLPQREVLPPAKIPATTLEADVDAATAARVRAALFDPLRNRQPESATGCAPQYGWKLSYIAGGDRVDFYICFGCGHAAVDLNGKTVAIAVFHGVSEELKQVMDGIKHERAPDAEAEPAEAPIPFPGVPR
jgi:hypothetical protein